MNVFLRYLIASGLIKELLPVVLGKKTMRGAILPLVKKRGPQLAAAVGVAVFGYLLGNIFRDDKNTDSKQ